MDFQIRSSAHAWADEADAKFAESDEQGRALAFANALDKVRQYSTLLQVNAESNQRWANKDSKLTEALESLIAEMAEKNSDFLDSEHLKALADLLDVTMAEEVTYQVTLVATVKVQVPRGEDRNFRAVHFGSSGLDVTHDDYESHMVDYEITDVDQD